MSDKEEDDDGEEGVELPRRVCQPPQKCSEVEVPTSPREQIHVV
jgi:hypothetical protein